MNKKKLDLNGIEPTLNNTEHYQGQTILMNLYLKSSLFDGKNSRGLFTEKILETEIHSFYQYITPPPTKPVLLTKILINLKQQNYVYRLQSNNVEKNPS